MEHYKTPSQSSNRPQPIPMVVWVIAAGVLVALIAIFVFDVALSTVGYFALIALFIGSHFFMHGSHGGHGSHADHGQNRAIQTNVDGPVSTTQPQTKKDEDTGHSSCC